MLNNSDYFFGNDDHLLINGLVGEPIVGKFSRQFVIDRLETDGYGPPLKSRDPSEFDASNAYHLMDRRDRQNWDCFAPNRTNGTYGTHSALVETRDCDFVGLNNFNGNHQRLQRASENLSEREMYRPYFHDTKLDCNWRSQPSAKLRREHSEDSRDHRISSFLVQHPATSDERRSTQTGLTSIPRPARSKDRTEPTPHQPVSPHKGSYVYPFTGPPTVVCQGQIVSIQVNPVQQGSDSGSEVDSGRESRIINAELTRREFGFGCTLTFEDEEEVFYEDVSTLPTFQTVLTGSSAKDSGIHLSEVDIDELNFTPISPLSSLESPHEVMRQDERRGAVTERRYGNRGRDPDPRKIPTKSSKAGATVSFHGVPHQRTTARSGIKELSRPLTSTPHDQQNRIRHKNKVLGVKRGQSVSEDHFDLDMKIPVADPPSAGAYERKNRWYKEVGDGRARARSSDERKRVGERHILEGHVGQHEINCEPRYMRDREKNKQKKLRHSDKDGRKLNVDVSVVNTKAEEGKNWESYDGKVRGRDKHRKTCDDRESMEHLAKDLQKLARFTRKPSSERDTTSEGRNDKRNKNNQKPVTYLKELPNAIARENNSLQQSQTDLRNQDESHIIRRNRKLEVGASNLFHETERSLAFRVVPRDPDTEKAAKLESRKTKRKDSKEDSRRVGKLSGSLGSLGCCGSDIVAVLDHGRPPERHGSSGNGDRPTEASSGCGADCELQRSPSISAESGRVTGLSTFFDGTSNVEFAGTERSPTTADDHLPRAKPHDDDKLQKVFGQEGTCSAMEPAKHAPQTSDKLPRGKLNPVNLPEVLKFPTSVGSAETQASPKNSRDSNSNLTDLIPVLPPPPGFGDEAACSPVSPLTRREVSVEKKKPPPPPPKLKPCPAVRLYQKRNAELSQEPLLRQPSKLPLVRNKPSPPVPNKVPLHNPSHLHIVSTGKECNELSNLNSSESPEAKVIAKAPDRGHEAAQYKQVKHDVSQKINFVEMAENIRKNYITRQVCDIKLDGNTGPKEEPYEHDAGSTIQNEREALQRKHESEEKAATQKAADKPQTMPKTRSGPTAMPTAPTKTQSVPPTGAKAEANVTAELPNGRLVEAALPREQARIDQKQEPGLTPNDNRIPDACFQVPLCLPAPPGFGDSTEVLADRTGSVSTRLPSSVGVDANSIPLISSGRYLSCPIDAWTPQDVGEWLESLGLGEHRYRFVRHSIDGARLKALDRNALVSLEMTNHLHRMHLERARMAQLRQIQQPVVVT